MRIWRLCRRPHATFDGEGARLFGGRWSRPGVPLVYTAGAASLAALEYLVQLSASLAPDDLVLSAADVPDDVATSVVEPQQLPAEWRKYPAPESLADLGVTWVREAATAVFRVPSAITPQESNYLLNPAHRDFKEVRISAAEPFSFDPRLWTVRRG